MQWLVLVPLVASITYWAMAGKAESTIHRHQQTHKKA